jgi:hypothetical protein
MSEYACRVQENGGKSGGRRLLLGIFISIAVVIAALLVVMALTAEEADAWSSTPKYGDPSNYASASVRYSIFANKVSGYNTESHRKRATDRPTCSLAYLSTSSEYRYDERRCYLGFPTGGFDDRTYISSAVLYVYVDYRSTSGNYLFPEIYIGDAQNADGYQVYDQILWGYALGGRPITTYDITYAWSISGSALTYLRQLVADDSDYVFIGFHAGLSNLERIELKATSSYIMFYYDASPPDTPTLSSTSQFTAGNSVGLSWNTVNDNPSNGARGVMAYEAGVFATTSSTGQPLFTSGWTTATSYTFSNLVDGVTYYFRARAVDFSGFDSGWSSTYRLTTMDASPPSIPVIEQEPLYTSGTSNVVDWADSTDAGVGLSYYQIQRATAPAFSGASTDTSVSSTYTFNDLASGTTYYYRVRAVDSYGYSSEWSVPQMSTQDADAPSVPVLMAEPLYSPGTSNVFNWHPSSDVGVGVWRYQVQVATDPSFSGGSMILSAYTVATSIEVSSLTDGRTYYCRVRAQDMFGKQSGWSESQMSIQDNMGPSVAGLQAIPTYSPEGPVRLEWLGATDAGVGTGWYYVQWSMNGSFTPVEDWKDHIVGSGFEISGLADNTTWYFRVCAVDMFTNRGEYEVVNTTIDGDPPEAPVIDAEPTYTMGTENTLSWQPSADELSGVDHYVLEVFATSAGTGLVFMDVTNMTHMTIPNLADGGMYYYRVTAVDMAGNTNASALVSSTQDASAPTPPHAMPLPIFTAGTTVSVDWRPSIDTGSGNVEYQLVWSTTEDFALTAGQTNWMTGTSYEVTGLTDGMAYYFRAWSRDALGQISQWGDMAGTIMDASPPPIPAFGDVPEFVPGPYVPLMWEPVIDGSGQRVKYQVLAYDTDEAGATPFDTSPWVPDPRFEWVGLPEDSAIYFRVTACDSLGLTSEPSAVTVCTIDTEGPSASAINPIETFTQGTTITLGWDSTNDAGISGIQYRLMVYEDADLSMLVQSHEWTSMAEAMVRNLVDGMTYYFVVEVRDAFGNIGMPSEAAITTMDASGPVVAVDAPGIFGSTDTAATGTCTDATSGVATVEYSVDGGDTWMDATVSLGTWSVDLSALSAGTTEVMVRATDNVGNTGMAVYATIDRDKPAISITLPASGEEVSGAVAIVGSISDPNLASYIVEVQKAGEATWTTVQPTQATAGVAGTLATWITSGMLGGDYTLRITASDAMDNSGAATVTVTLKGAHLSIGPGDITFSDSHPLPGDTVTVLVTVRNDGDSPAEGVTVSLFDGGKLVGTQDGETVPAHGTAVVPVKVKAEGSHVFTARATSDLYDTGDMPTGQPLQTIEEEAVLENAGGILGLIALIIALIALLLVLMGRMGGKEEPEPVEEEPDDVILDPIMEDPSFEEQPPQGQ